MKSIENNGDGKPQESTTRLPMVDLETAIKTVEAIREKALETAPMNDVAVALGYGSATSTPFYRRIAAARMFGLLSSKSSLTQCAIDYIRPRDEEMKSKVLADSIRGIPGYKDLLTRYEGKKLNVQLVKNSIAKDNNLSDGCSLICAKAFESSLVFARMLRSDGVVNVSQLASEEKRIDAIRAGDFEDRKITRQSAGNSMANGVQDIHQHTIFLDKEKLRSFSFTGPLEISRSEYDRICSWLQFTMIIAD